MTDRISSLCASAWKPDTTQPAYFGATHDSYGTRFFPNLDKNPVMGTGLIMSIPYYCPLGKPTHTHTYLPAWRTSDISIL
jgi:hypothetical protein